MINASLLVYIDSTGFVLFITNASDAWTIVNLIILTGSKVQDIYLEDKCNLAKSFVSAVSAIPVLEIYFKKQFIK